MMISLNLLNFKKTIENELKNADKDLDKSGNNMYDSAYLSGYCSALDYVIRLIDDEIMREMIKNEGDL